MRKIDVFSSSIAYLSSAVILQRCVTSRKKFSNPDFVSYFESLRGNVLFEKKFTPKLKLLSPLRTYFSIKHSITVSKRKKTFKANIILKFVLVLSVSLFPNNFFLSVNLFFFFFVKVKLTSFLLPWLLLLVDGFFDQVSYVFLPSLPSGPASKKTTACFGSKLSKKKLFFRLEGRGERKRKLNNAFVEYKIIAKCTKKKST